jgi:hypothetical protein
MSIEDPKVALVIASVRQDQFRMWVDDWWGNIRSDRTGFPWDVTVLVQDGEGPRFTPDRPGSVVKWQEIKHYTWGDIGKSQPGLNLPPWLSRRDSGIKAWGFQKAFLEHGADVVITLDDDCMPSYLGAHPSWYRKNPPAGYDALKDAARCEFVSRHMAALTRTSRWTSTIPGFVPRGLPYGTPDPLARNNSLGRLPLFVNMGIWETIPDRDAVHELTNRDPEGYYRVWRPQRAIYRHTRVMPHRQYWPLCGMNLAFRREAAPLMYFPRMGEGTPFRRFDDIWCGIILQRCLRQLGWSAGVGSPIVSHQKASDPMNNLVHEAAGIRANEEFWQIVDERINFAPEDYTPLACMLRVGASLREPPYVVNEDLRRYLPELGGWITDWCSLFVKAGWE